MTRSVQLMTFAMVLVASVFALSLFTSPAEGTKFVGLEPSQIGSVDVFGLIDLGIMTEERVMIRDDYSVRGDEALTPMYKKDADLKNMLNNMEPNDPAAADIYQQYQTNLNQLQQMTQQINAGYQQLLAKQIADLYKVVYAATNEIATEHGYSYVFASRSDSELIQMDSIQGVTQEILARPLVMVPEATDLTEMVRIKLKYPTKEEIDAAVEAKAAAFELEAEAARKQVQEATDAALEELEGASESTEPAESTETP